MPTVERQSDSRRKLAFPELWLVVEKECLRRLAHFAFEE
jgi:hypothetical protein